MKKLFYRDALGLVYKNVDTIPYLDFHLGVETLTLKETNKIPRISMCSSHFQPSCLKKQTQKNIGTY